MTEFAVCANTELSSRRSRHTGKERDAESGNDYFGARYYASTMGRMLSPDPSQLYFADPTNPQSLNLYSYAQNSPLKNTDLDGLRCVWDDGSFDSEDDPNTGSKTQCEGGTNGGTWYDPGTYASGVDWASANQDGTLALHGVTGSAQSVTVTGTVTGLATDASLTLAGGFADIGLAYANMANFVTGGQQVPYYRFFMNHYCGPGGGGAPNSTMDKACQVHDACFNSAGLDASVNVGVSANTLNSGKVNAAKSCNQALYNAASSNPNAKGANAIRLWLTQGDKTTPFVGFYLLYPGTAAKP